MRTIPQGVRATLRDLDRIRGTSILGYDYRRSGPKKYSRLSPARAIELARSEFQRAIEREKGAMTDWEYWGDFMHRGFCEAVLAVLEGVVLGRTVFTPLTKKDPLTKKMVPVDRLDLLDWAKRVRRSNPK